MFEPIASVQRFVQKKSKIAEWQEYAARLCDELGFKGKDRGRVFSAVKRYPRGYVEASKTFLLDYEGNVPKIELFFWKLNKEASANPKTNQETKEEVPNPKGGKTNLRVVGNKKSVSGEASQGSEKMSLMQLNFQLTNRSYSTQIYQTGSGQRLVKLAVNLWGMPPTKNLAGIARSTIL